MIMPRLREVHRLLNEAKSKSRVESESGPDQPVNGGLGYTKVMPQEMHFNTKTNLQFKSLEFGKMTVIGMVWSISNTRWSLEMFQMWILVHNIRIDLSLK